MTASGGLPLSFPNSVPLSFPNSVWERIPRNSVSRPVPERDAKQSFADVRSQAELGNEGTRNGERQIHEK